MLSSREGKIQVMGVELVGDAIARPFQQLRKSPYPYALVGDVCSPDQSVPTAPGQNVGKDAKQASRSYRISAAKTFTEQEEIACISTMHSSDMPLQGLG
jgi:hypothetical protein